MRKKSGGQKQTAESTVPAAMWSGTQLPQELVLDILYRLPPKSICRFKCVSKLWLTLLSDPNFAKTQLNRNNNNNNNNKRERLILISDYLYSVDCAEASNNNDAVIATKVLDLLPIECPEEFEILGSCNGLLLVSDVDSNKFLLNPSIREIRTLDESPFAYNSVCGHTTYGLGYDSSTDDYKVVAIEARDDAEYDDCDESCCTYTTVSVYSLKTDSWTRIQDVPHYHSYIMISSLVHLNGFIHWLTFGSYGYSFVIAAFDLLDEKFRELQTPRSLDTNNFNLVFCKFEVYRGCLCMLVPQNGTQTDVWVMKKYGVTESWTKCTMFEPNLYMMEPLFFLEDEEVVLERNGQRLVAFNAKEKTSRDIVVHGIPAMFKAGKTYVESLVSPYHVCGIDCVFESMIEAFGAGREQSVAKAKRSRSIEASNSIADRLFSDFLDCLKSTWTLETPIYEKALKMLKEPYWRERFISMLDERKRANRTGLEVEGEETKNWVQLTNCSTHTDQEELVSLSQGAGSESGPIPGNEAFHRIIGTRIRNELDLGYGAKPTQSTSSNCAEVEAANKRANEAEERARNAERMASEALEKLKEMEEFWTNMEQQIRAFNNCMAGQSLDLDTED